MADRKERPKCRKKLEKMFNDGYKLIINDGQPYLWRKEEGHGRVRLSKGMQIQARKMLREKVRV